MQPYCRKKALKIFTKQFLYSINGTNLNEFLTTNALTQYGYSDFNFTGIPLSVILRLDIHIRLSITKGLS